MGAEHRSNHRSAQHQAADQPTPESTSLKWGSDGELSPVDLQRVLERLTDPTLTRCSLESAE